MFTLKEKIQAVLQNVKTLESSLRDAVDAKTPNVYTNHLNLQIKICEDSLQVYLNQIPKVVNTPIIDKIYSLE